MDLHKTHCLTSHIPICICKVHLKSNEMTVGRGEHRGRWVKNEKCKSYSVLYIYILYVNCEAYATNCRYFHVIKQYNIIRDVDDSNITIT